MENFVVLEECEMNEAIDWIWFIRFAKDNVREKVELELSMCFMYNQPLNYFPSICSLRSSK